MKYFVSEKNGYNSTIFYCPVGDGYIGVEYKKNGNYVGTFFDFEINYDREIKDLPEDVQQKVIFYLFRLYWV